VDAGGSANSQFAQIGNEAGLPLVTSSCIQGYIPGGELTGEENIGDDPQLADPLGADGIAGTGDESYELTSLSPCLDTGSTDAVSPDAFDLDRDGDFAEAIPVDRSGKRRLLDDPFSDGYGVAALVPVDRGAFEYAIDCNANGQMDYLEIEADPELDYNGDGILDVCSFKVADELTPPAGTTRLVEPFIEDENKAFYHPVEKRVYAKESGIVFIGWAEDDAEAGYPRTATEMYAIIPTHPTVAIYRTDDPNNGPTVSMDPVYQAQAEPVIHYNSTIQYRSDPEPNTLLPPDADAYLFLKNLYAMKKGQVLVEYRDRLSQRLLAFEIVEIRDTIPAYISAEAGDQLLPTDPGLTSRTAEPSVVQGTYHTYKQTEEGPTKWFVFAIRSTRSLADIEIYWFQERELLVGGMPIYVYWPSELSRYIVHWPEVPQLNLVGQRAGGDSIPIVDLSAHGQAEIKYQDPPTHAEFLGDRQFHVKAPGMTTLMYSYTLTNGKKFSFDVIKTIDHDDADCGYPITQAWDIGKRIEDASHAYGFYASGYVFSGTAYDPGIYEANIFHKPGEFSPSDDRAIIPVNRGDIEVWWYRESTTRQGEPSGVAWPFQSGMYLCDWPETPDGCIILSSERGIGPFSSAVYAEPSIYQQGTLTGDSQEVGYNPNEEHAEWITDPGDKIYAARDDLNQLYRRSESYVLFKYKDLLATKDIEHAIATPWEMDVIRVARTGSSAPECPCNESTSGPCDFVYSVTAGTALRPPIPLVFPIHDPFCSENAIIASTLFWDDTRGKHWFRVGDDSVPAQYWERWEGQCTPWLDTDLSDGKIDDPQIVTWEVQWPSYPQSILPPGGGGVPIKDVYIDLQLGETRIRDLSTGVRQAEILYNETGASLIRPWKPSYVGLASTNFPADYLTYYGKLPPHIKARLGYDDVNEKLYFEGLSSQNLLGIMSRQELQIINGTFHESHHAAFRSAAAALYAQTQQPGVNAVGTIVGPDNPDWGIAVSAGSAVREGWLVLGYNGNIEITEPSDVEVFQVVCPLYQGDITVIYPDCVFDEQVTLRWSGDCAGDCAPFEFRWQYAVGARPGDYDDIDPNTTPAFSETSEWRDWTHETGASGWVLGKNEVLIGGDRNPLFTLTDNWFRVSIRVPDPLDYPGEVLPEYPCATHVSSAWTDAQLAEGWLKRVKRQLNPFDQRIRDFTNSRVATYVSMIQQLGNPYMDRVGLTCDPEVINNLGLIEMYQAVLFRGRSFTIDNGIDYAPANQALMLFAGNLADFYMLIANEAYGDSLDPTIAIDLETNEAASSMFCFQDQLPTSENSLLYEELALLRGRDGRGGTPVDRFPVYNRLYWNFTSGDGQVAYKNNYNIQDLAPLNDDGSRGDGFINEQDAKTMFPQGYGDAWGHYLTAMKFYYEMLRHPYFSWPIRSEAVLVDQVPVEVSYAHERKFAKDAAAKAKCGAEIMDLTYREQYSEDPSDQWSGYADEVEDRQWGGSEWGQRAFLGAYFDWAAGNAILPSVDSNPSHAGTIKQVARTTVTDLKEIVVHADAIHSRMDEADAGLNPLGLAKSVVPFDIKPLEDMTHFEQVYARALVVLNQFHFGV
jgi:hypothetical protein